MNFRPFPTVQILGIIDQGGRNIDVGFLFGNSLLILALFDNLSSDFFSFFSKTRLSARLDCEKKIRPESSQIGRIDSFFDSPYGPYSLYLFLKLRTVERVLKLILTKRSNALYKYTPGPVSQVSLLMLAKNADKKAKTIFFTHQYFTVLVTHGVHITLVNFEND